ncbi:MAG: hypothetical protein H6868_09295 [Rhodospirillales bacterium]|nr:hypothetical protein [Rhodospirillales bacterium]
MSCAQVNAQLSILNDIKTTVGGDYEAMSSEDRKNMSQKWHHEIPVKQAVYEEDGFEERMIRLVSLSQKHGCE